MNFHISESFASNSTTTPRASPPSQTFLSNSSLSAYVTSITVLLLCSYILLKSQFKHKIYKANTHIRITDYNKNAHVYGNRCMRSGGKASHGWHFDGTLNMSTLWCWKTCSIGKISIDSKYRTTMEQR